MKSIFVLVALALAAVATGERAHLIVNKSVKEDPVVADSSMTVIFTVYNAGDSAAYDISIGDSSWPAEHFDLFEGKTSFKFPKIEAGANETAEFVLKPKVHGEYKNGPATGSYRPNEDSDETQDLTSSSIPRFRILSTNEKYIRLLLIAGKYVSLGYFKTIQQWTNGILFFSVVAVLVGGNQMALRMKRHKKQRDHQAAVKYFENTQNRKDK